MAITQLKSEESEKVCRDISATLPEWFGIPEANEKYAKGVKERLSFGFMENGDCLGMLTLEFPFPSTANIFWMGVKKGSQEKGIGEALLLEAEKICQLHNIYTLTLETLSPKEGDSYYLKTYHFYLNQGFRPLFELSTYGEDYLMAYLCKVLSPKIFKWVDLTHELSDKTPAWSEEGGFKHTDITAGNFLVQHLDMIAGIGTHIDAPIHCFPKGKTIAELPLNTLITPCVVINVSPEAHEGYIVEMAAIERFEKQYGPISKNTFVIFYTGWDRLWAQPDKYRNNLRFPTVSKQVAEYLVARDIAGIGIDTLSPDGPDSGFPVHQALLGSDKYIIENIANSCHLPPAGSYILALPIKTSGSEAPIRLLGMI